MKKSIALLLSLAICLFCFSSCNFMNLFSKNDTDTKVLKIGVLNGPTGMGMSSLMEDVKQDSSLPYEFVVYSTPDTAVTDFLIGEVDIVSLPTNTASIIYNKQDASVRVLAINCLSALFVVSKKELHISSIQDLAGKTVVTSVPSSTTKPVLEYLLQEQGVTSSVDVVSTHDALVAEMMKGTYDIAVLPEPKVSALLLQSDLYEVSLSIGEIWSQTTDTQLPMGCILAKQSLIDDHKEVLTKFLSDYESSVSFIGNLNNRNEAAAKIVSSGILPKTAIAENALKNLDGVIVLIHGEEMKNDLFAFYTLLNESMPSSIGNHLPKDEFYYDY